MLNSRAAFVVVGLAVNLLTLVRGVALMLWLDYAALGLVALVQSVIMFGGMLHFGLLNGGYRLLCHARGAYRQRIVDMAYSAFAVLFSGFAIAGVLASAFGETAEYRLAALLTMIGASATLVRSWIGNELVATGSLRAGNVLNAGSIAVSLAALIFIEANPPLVAIISIVLQPVVFVLAAFVSGAALRPRRFRIPTKLAKLVLKAGFLVFLTGIALQLNTQMERWYVGSALGIDSLGRLYLAFLFLTLFQMVPTLLDQVVLPKIVLAHKAGTEAQVRREIRMLLVVYLGYCIAAVAGVWILAEPLLNVVLPRYVADLHWVKLLVPGLVVFAMSNPFALVFNVLIEYRWYVRAYGLGVLLTGIIFGTALATGNRLDLDQVVLARTAIFAIMGFTLFFGSHHIARRYRGFRPFNRLSAFSSSTPEALP